MELGVSDPNTPVQISSMKTFIVVGVEELEHQPNPLFC